MLPLVRSAAEIDDRDCSALRAVAARCSGRLRQELFDEILSRLHRPRAPGYGGQSIPEDVVREVSPAAASRLRAALLERAEDGNDDLLGALAAKLSVHDALAALRDALQSRPAPYRDDAPRLVAGLVPRMDEFIVQEVLALVQRMLSAVAEVSPSTRDPWLAERGSATAVLMARHALAKRLEPSECAEVVDDILRAPNKRPPWEADFVAALVSDASPRGHELAGDIARQLDDKDAAAVYDAIVATGVTTSTAAAVRLAVERLRMRIEAHPVTHRRAPSARLLGAVARACDGVEAEYLFSEALVAAQTCTSYDNEQCTVLLDLARGAPISVRVDALAQAIMSYSPQYFGQDPDPLLLRLVVAVRELGPACHGVVAVVAYGCSDKPRSELLSRLAIVGAGASPALGADWADDVALSLTQVRSWWP